MRSTTVLTTAPARDNEIRKDVRSFAGTYLALLGSSAISTVLGLATTLVLIALLGRQEYGRWALLLALINGAVVLGTNWTLLGLVRLGCEELLRDGTVRRVFWARALILALSLPVVGAGLWLGWPWLAGDRGAEASWAALVLAAVATSALSLHVQYTLQAAKQMARSGLGKILERGPLLAGVLGLAGFGLLSVRSATLLFVLCNALAALLLLATLQRRLWLPPGGAHPALKPLVVFSLPCLLINPFQFLDSGHLDVIVLSRFVPYEEVGLYFFASQLAGVLLQLGAVASTLLLPILTTVAVVERSDLIKKYLTRLLPHVVFLWSLALCGVLVASQYLVPTLLGERFAPSLLPFNILLLACATSLVWQIAYHPVTVAYKWTWLHPWIQIPSGLVNLGLDLLLIPWFGLEGCALATVAANLSFSALFILLTRRQLAISRALDPLLAIAPLPVALLCFSFWWQPLWGGLALAVTCVLVVKGLGLFTAADWQLLDEVPLPRPLRQLAHRLHGLLCRRGTPAKPAT
jgi:O-antigen/teichoic acid export membrane protein